MSVVGGGGGAGAGTEKAMSEAEIDARVRDAFLPGHAGY
jgi:hypothetical protein